MKLLMLCLSTYIWRTNINEKKYVSKLEIGNLLYPDSASSNWLDIFVFGSKQKYDCQELQRGGKSIQE